MELNRYKVLVTLCNTLGDDVTYNTLENIVNKMETLTDSQISELMQTAKTISAVKEINNIQIKEKILNKIINELEVYVSQL